MIEVMRGLMRFHHYAYRHLKIYFKKN